MSESKPKYKQFLQQEGYFKPTRSTKSVDKIEPGVYEIHQPLDGDIVFSHKPIVTDDFIELPSMVTSQVLKDIETFWKPETKARFAHYGLVHKRGIILHGTPGTGKTCTVMKVIKSVVDEGGIAIYNCPPSLFNKAIEALRDIQGDCHVVCVFEEFDKYCNSPDFLSLLDGELQVANVIYIATTNHIDLIPDALKKRPSRFAKVLKVAEPDAEARRVYLSTKLNGAPADLIEYIVDNTKGFILDQLKDVVISTGCFGIPLEEALYSIRALGQKDSIGIQPEQESPSATSPFSSMLKNLYGSIGVVSVTIPPPASKSVILETEDDDAWKKDEE